MMKCLKVEDALSYLDQVKARFAGQGAIYTDFLDVMREFKTQTIGTEAVIRRVRELFEGHPDLIVGFNTFIPQGYRMEAPVSRLNNTTSGRSNLAVSALDHVSPVKTYSTNVKSSEGASDWCGSTTLPSSISGQHENRVGGYGASASVPPLTGSPPSKTQISDGASYGPATQQPLLGSNYQENYPNTVRGPYSVTTSVGTPQPIPSHVYQQQQQAQSFNHALLYVNKIKNRFQGNPDAYRRFLDILQWYQKEQRHSDPLRRKQAELQVYQDVSKLFDGQEDLLQEFSQFLPESTGVTSAVTESIIGRKFSGHVQPTCPDPNPNEASLPALQPVSRISEGPNVTPPAIRQRLESPNASVLSSTVTHVVNSDTKKLKRLAPAPSVPLSMSSNLNTPGGAAKKSRSNIRDVSISDVNQLVTSVDAVLLHKIRVALDADGPSGDRAYQTFQQILKLFNRNMLSVEELLEATRSLFPRHSDVWKRFHDMIMLSTPYSSPELGGILGSQSSDVRDKDKPDRDRCSLSDDSHEAPGLGHLSLNAFAEDAAQKRLDLDFSKLRLCGTSYRALPSNFPQSKCSGRQKCPIAKEVLNDSFISFSSLTSEDSQFVSSKKNQYEENMYRVEDERYEVDMVTELNRMAMHNLVVVKRKMDNMKREELAQFQLDDNLSGTSAILMRKAIHRVYGDKAGDVILGLKTCPETVVPLVIQRMRQKDTEWREAIRGYQRSWAEQDARNYLRSLDHQGATFKQRDAPLIRSKTMVSQIEAIAKDDKSCHGITDPVGTMISASLTQHCLTARTDFNSPGTIGSALINVNEGYKEPGTPHLALVYPPTVVRNTLLEDAASLIIHHVKRQSNTSKEDKRTMKFLVRTVVQDIFMADRFPMSDDEEEDEDEFDSKDEDETLRDNHNELPDCSRTRGASRKPISTDREVVTAGPDGSGSRGTARPKIEEGNLDSRCSRSPSIHADGAGSATSPMDVDCEKPHGSDAMTRTVAGLRNKHPVALPPRSFELPCGVSLPPEEYYSLLYGNNHWYAIIRLHHLLLCRLHLFRSRSVEVSSRIVDKQDPPIQAAELLRLRRFGGTEPSDYYHRALNLVKDLLDGGEDISTYEDRLRDMFGIYAYPWFTMDRLIINIVRQLQALASGDELSRRLTNLYRSWTCGTNYSSSGTIPVPHRFIHANTAGASGSGSYITLPQHSGIRGPLRTRVCRMANEANYRIQALSVCSEFAGPSGSNANLSNNIIVPSHSSGALNGNATSTGLPQTLPNCYALVMLNEASTMLIRLVIPTTCPSTCDAAETPPQPCMVHHMPHWPTCITQQSASTDCTGNVGLFHQTPARHWADYMNAHLLWTTGYMPHNIARHIRPVFLYRTVRRCMNALTRTAYRRRQQELVDTGDTQPEELLMKASRVIVSSAMNSTDDGSDAGDTDERHETDSSCFTKNGKNANDFQQDVWEFMCHVFKSDLTRKELFRDTYSSDCMQSTDSLTSKVNPRAHKINWSVGSYGIFVRRKQKPATLRCPSTKRWREFHTNWLSANKSRDSELILGKQSSAFGVPMQSDASAEALHFDPTKDETSKPSINDSISISSADPAEMGHVSLELISVDPPESSHNQRQSVANEGATRSSPDKRTAMETDCAAE
ncbi:Paired amphipathic helix protein Sin3a [Fasciola gigantica]|uniref:Paired amphipathic helix protein Sin3a n=1 Tax=Fasciola gigantica TaxID=46835 RepID=A0A504Z318_FASGI|nr:Paired amphipathic helix protein Sin3a [Fasciola gigantica]